MEKSKGFPGNPAPGPAVAFLCPDWFSAEVDTEELLSSAAPTFSSEIRMIFKKVKY